MENNLTINLNPSLEILIKIKEWLYYEYRNSNQGFYLNWNRIESAFEKNELITIEQDENSVGFVVFSGKDFFVSIDFFGINSSFRSRGFGKIFFDALCLHYQQRNFKVIKLHCETIEAELFWIKMGFIIFPDIGYSMPDLTYYKPLIKVKPILEKSLQDRFEMWDLEPYQVQGRSPRWVWEYQNLSVLAEVPILFPCNGNWNLRAVVNNTIVKESKIKYFNKNYDLEKPGSFLFINHLNFLDI